MCGLFCPKGVLRGKWLRSTTSVWDLSVNAAKVSELQCWPLHRPTGRNGGHAALPSATHQRAQAGGRVGSRKLLVHDLGEKVDWQDFDC